MEKVYFSFASSHQLPIGLQLGDWGVMIPSPIHAEIVTGLTLCSCCVGYRCIEFVSALVPSHTEDIVSWYSSSTSASYHLLFLETL